MYRMRIGEPGNLWNISDRTLMNAEMDDTRGTSITGISEGVVLGDISSASDGQWKCCEGEGDGDEVDCCF